MKRIKRMQFLLIGMIFAVTITACGETPGGQESSVSGIEKTESKENAHTHSFETVVNNDGTHTIKCTGEGCNEAKTENCVFDDDYNCSVCGFKHEHKLSAESNGEGMHRLVCNKSYCDFECVEKCSYNDEYVCGLCEYRHEHVIETVSDLQGKHEFSCTVEDCDFSQTEVCVLNEEYICEECGWQHEHVMEYAVSEDGKKHSAKCSFAECCSFYEESDCTIEHLKCSACGYEVDWKSKLIKSEFSGYWQEGTYYAQKKFPVYASPDKSGEVIKYLDVNDTFYLKWRYNTGDEEYYVSDEYECIAVSDVGFTYSTNRFDLRMGTTGQVVVTKQTLKGNTYTSQGVYKVFDSYDEAVKHFYGVSWSTVKSTWTYIGNEGTPFMPYYSDNSKTGQIGQVLRVPQVFTHNGSIPYSISPEDGVVYYFQ